MPTAFGKYLLHARIATGGMAEVWRATLPGANGIDKHCVVKRILPRFAGDESFVRMFLREAKLSIALQHGNIVSVFDFGLAGDTYYLAMEHVVGHDLGTVLERLQAMGERLPVPLAVLVATELSRALAYAHDKTDPEGVALGIVHRDVSPSNVLLSSEGEVKLVDFGIAKAQTSSLHTQATDLKGKIPYMSPEQARLEELDARADVWAVGVVVYEMLAGRRPYLGRDHFDVLNRIRDAAPVDPLRVLRPDLPDELDAVVRACLSPRREDRPTDGRDLQVRLTSIAARRHPGVTGADLRGFLADLFGSGEVRGTPSAGREELPYADTALARTPPARARDAHDTDSDADGYASDTGGVTTVPGKRSLHQAPTAIFRPPAEDAPTGPGALGTLGRVARVRRFRVTVMAITFVALLGAALFAMLHDWQPRGAPAPPAPTPRVTPPVLPRAQEPVRAQPAAQQVPADPRPSKAPPEEPSRPAAPAAPERSLVPRTGMLSVNSTPWAEVWVDGRRAAESTPANLRLPAGPHTVRLTNPELALRGTYQVRVEAGQIAHLAVRLSGGR